MLQGVGEMNIIIWIIDKIRLEVCRRQILNINRCKCQIDRQFITTHTFSYWCFKIYGRVIIKFNLCINITPISPYFLFFCSWSCQSLLNATIILSFLHLALLLVNPQFCTIGSGILYDNNLAGYCWNLKTIFIFDQNDFTFESSDDTTACRTQKSNFISYFHLFSS